MLLILHVYKVHKNIQGTTDSEVAFGIFMSQFPDQGIHGPGSQYVRDPSLYYSPKQIEIAMRNTVVTIMEAHKKFGKLPFKETITPAITLAKNGFQPEWFSLYKLASMLPMLNRYSELGKTFLPNGNLNFAHMTNGENKLIQSDSEVIP